MFFLLFFIVSFENSKCQAKKKQTGRTVNMQYKLSTPNTYKIYSEINPETPKAMNKAITIQGKINK